MAIDPNTESLVSFAEATKLIPSRRGGRRCHVSTIHRWSQQGVRGVRLEYLQCGGTRVTSREALARFFSRLTNGTTDTSGCETPARRRKAVERAIRDLEEQGA